MAYLLQADTIREVLNVQVASWLSADTTFVIKVF